MRTHLKEIIFSIIALLVMTLAIISFFKVMKTEKSNEREDIYRLIPSDVNAMLMINRPGVFDRMILEKQSFYNMFASEVPDVFLSFMRKNQQMQLMILSFHPQGVICYIQAGDRVLNALEKNLQREYKAYSPLKQTIDGIDYYYYSDVDNRFLGYYVYNGIWVGSFSKRLLENVGSRHQENKLTIPNEMTQLIKSFDTNAPLNIIFPTKDFNLYTSQENFSIRRIEQKWLGADLFISDGSLCCYGALPYEPGIHPSLYKAIGDTIARRVESLYPQVSLSFQIDREEDFVYFTGCTPIPK